jgi:hypothetical protein
MQRTLCVSSTIEHAEQVAQFSVVTRMLAG